MKCELLCERCGDRARKETFPDPNKYEGEQVLLHKGECEGVYICDFCNADILPGDTAVAQTFVLLDRDDPNTKWFEEQRYLTKAVDMYSS